VERSAAPTSECAEGDGDDLAWRPARDQMATDLLG